MYDEIMVLRRKCRFREAVSKESEYRALKECLKDIEVLWPNEKPDKPRKGGWVSSNIRQQIEEEYPSKKSP